MSLSQIRFIVLANLLILLAGCKAAKQYSVSSLPQGRGYTTVDGEILFKIHEWPCLSGALLMDDEHPSGIPEIEMVSCYHNGDYYTVLLNGPNPDGEYTSAFDAGFEDEVQQLPGAITWQNLAFISVESVSGEPSAWFYNTRG